MLNWVAITSLIAVIIGGGGLIAAIVGMRKLSHEVTKLQAESKKLDLEGDSILAESARHLLDPLNDRINEQEHQISLMKEKHRVELMEMETRYQNQMAEMQMEIDKLSHCKDEHVIRFQQMDKKIKALQDKNNRLINGINILINQLRLNGQQPMWEPHKDDCETIEQ